MSPGGADGFIPLGKGCLAGRRHPDRPLDRPQWVCSMIHRALKWLLSTLCVGLLTACASQPPAEDTASADSGPTLYGRLGVSIDHASVE